MNMMEHNLLMIMEECDEASQRASKQMRFGPYSVEPGKTENNRDRLRSEILDVLASVEILIEAQQIDPIDSYNIREHLKLKKLKLQTMYDLSRAQGCLHD